MTKLKCNHCQSENEVKVRIKFFRNKMAKNNFDPKYNFVLSAYCRQCDKYIKHLPQNDLLIGYTNQKLDNLWIT